MTAKTVVHPLLIVFSSFIEFIFKPFVRKHRQTPTTQEVFENDARETVHEIEDREPVVDATIEESDDCAQFVTVPEIRAPKGIALRKSVMFLARSGNYRSAKVVGWDSDGSLILSRKNGPPFRRALIAE